jgi:hypothetical protein
MSASAGLDRRREYMRNISVLLLMSSALADLLMDGRGETEERQSRDC